MSDKDHNYKKLLKRFYNVLVSSTSLPQFEIRYEQTF